MIVNLSKFIGEERPAWERLEAILKKMEDDPAFTLDVAEARELDKLYRRASADLARLGRFAAEPEARGYLENLVSRGHSEIHGTRANEPRLRPWLWLTATFPRTFRRHISAFGLCVALTAGGALFGAAAVAFDPSAKDVLMPFSYLQGSPTDRVAREEHEKGEHASHQEASFSGFLITHNIQVTLFGAALGISWGVGTAVLIIENGIMLGAVAVDYVLSGQTPFLLGWLLPHGVIEIPAILIGGQAGFVIAAALIGKGEKRSLAARLRGSAGDVVTLAAGASLLLVWAGGVEAFFSQYHEPVIPYAVKIGFGLAEAAGLACFLAYAGRGFEGGKA
ncbi:MAG TPA: stage II sporulation protein M [Opitutaceae bacterium]